MVDNGTAENVMWALKIALQLYCSGVVILPLASVFQERRIWNPPADLPSLTLMAHVKIYLFNVVWMGVTLIGGAVILPKHILGMLLGGIFNAEFEAHFVERMTGLLVLRLFVGEPELRGLENLPPDDGSVPAPVYIANHASQVDLGAVYFLRRRFKWISKQSVKYLPGVGLIMTLGGHIMIKRRGKNKKSVSNLYEQSDQAIQAGVPMFFFPQGTRRMSGHLPFKDGAFKVALANESTLVPVSIEIPLSCWKGWYPLCLLWGGKFERVVLTVHKPVPVTKDMDIEDLKKKTYDIIHSVLAKKEK